MDDKILFLTGPMQLGLISMLTGGGKSKSTPAGACDRSVKSFLRLARPVQVVAVLDYKPAISAGPQLLQAGASLSSVCPSGKDCCYLW